MMAEVMYELHLLVPIRMLTPLLELLEGDGVVVEVGLHTGPAPPKKRRPGMPNQMTQAFQAVLNGVGRLTTEDLERRLRAAGRRPGAASSVVPNLVREGSIVRHEDGRLEAIVGQRARSRG